ncbi:M20/M25/M40 family metallo-hydrolase [Microbacterium murale]|uniref:Glutamate carboxypeptidase n=1 Tax=Microbacterium murale TaxID=1081040 RepID=A0ABU0P9X5_9MICO|nr:M20/M25/M40 family metallo-hydrolase [Microbacterium murale]MDQ0644128.1 glutamate carboxypeptidase [Microbacterium murale]
MNDTEQAKALVERLAQLTLIESPSLDVAASDKVVDLLAHWWRAAGAQVRTVPTSAGMNLVADIAGDGDPILLVGHSDTVWPVGTLRSDVPWVDDGEVVRGPGVYDMKSGLLVMLAAAERLRGRSHRAFRVVVVCDEEIGSPTTSGLLRECAAGVRAAIGFESPHPDGALKVGRRGSTRVRLAVTGRASHAALDPEGGVSAIDELVDQLRMLRTVVADPNLVSEVLCNVGTIRGGGRANVVPADAEAEIGLRFVDPATEAQVLSAIRSLQPIRNGARLQVDLLSHRPAWRASDADEELLYALSAAATGIGQHIEGRPAAGAGDTNLLGSLGVPTVDGFGPRGGGAHAVDEHILTSSLLERVALLEAFLSGK